MTFRYLFSHDYYHLMYLHAHMTVIYHVYMVVFYCVCTHHVVYIFLHIIAVKFCMCNMVIYGIGADVCYYCICT